MLNARQVQFQEERDLEALDHDQQSFAVLKFFSSSM